MTATLTSLRSVPTDFVDVVDIDEPISGAQRAATADAATVERLVLANLPLVGHMVREVAGRVPAHVHRDDLASAAMFALTITAQQFDESLGVPFARYAAIRIRGALTDELRSMDWASRSVRGRARELNSARAELAQVLSREPSSAEVAQVMGISVGELGKLESDVHRAGVTSLQAVTGLNGTNGDDLVRSTTAGPETMLVQREQIGYLHDAIAELPEKLRFVVEEYFFANRKMADIGAELGVTESRVSQLRSEALKLIHAALSTVDHAPVAARTTGRASTREAYCASVASRSTLAGRLATTSVLGEVRTTLEPTLRVAN